MPPSSKTGAAAKDRRKSDKAEKAAKVEKVETVADEHASSPGFITMTVSAKKLRALFEPASAIIKEDSPTKVSSATSNTHPAVNGENSTDSAPNTPAASGTPAPPSTMGPPVEGPKKKGVKRSSAAMNGVGDGVPKPRGKPGPKKKQRLEDGTIDPRPSLGAAHKLGPKANQGAINAGLRALDRSGKPCRKWAKSGFTIKTFTGVVWGLPRWTAPPKPKPEAPADESATASAEGSSKENKDNEQAKSDNSNSGGDVEMQSVPSIHASSPAPPAVAVAS